MKTKKIQLCGNDWFKVCEKVKSAFIEAKVEFQVLYTMVNHFPENQFSNDFTGYVQVECKQHVDVWARSKNGETIRMQVTV